MPTRSAVKAVIVEGDRIFLWVPLADVPSLALYPKALRAALGSILADGIPRYLGVEIYRE